MYSTALVQVKIHLVFLKNKNLNAGAVHSLGKEQFLGLYLGAGVISSFTSYVYKVITKQPGLSLGAVSVLINK